MPRPPGKKKWSRARNKLKVDRLTPFTFRVYGGANEHIVRYEPETGNVVCDCYGASLGKECSHIIAVSILLFGDTRLKESEDRIRKEQEAAKERRAKKRRRRWYRRHNDPNKGDPNPSSS